MTTPLLDVLLPVRSPAPWLEETLRGLQQQTFLDFTLRVMLHGTDDKSRALVLQMFPDAVIEQHSESLSFSELLNSGLRQSRARYIARIDADDIPLPTRFAKQVGLMERNPSVGVVATSVVLIDSFGNQLQTRLLPGTADALLAKLQWKNVIPHPSVVFRRDLVAAIGGYNPRALHAEDYELWLRIARYAQLMPVVEPLTLYRVHATQISRVKYLGSECIEAVATARRELATSRGESRLLQSVRQCVWAIRQIQRRITNRSA